MRTSHGFVCTILALTALGMSSGGALARPFHRLTHVPGVVDYWPRFSPDGRTALFSRCEIPTGCGGASTCVRVRRSDRRTVCGWGLPWPGNRPGPGENPEARRGGLA